MIKVLFVCHGTTWISPNLPPWNHEKQRFFHSLLPIYYFSEFRYDINNKQSQRRPFPPLSGLLFLCLLFCPKRVFRQTNIFWLYISRRPILALWNADAGIDQIVIWESAGMANPLKYRFSLGIHSSKNRLWRNAGRSRIRCRWVSSSKVSRIFRS